MGAVLLTRPRAAAQSLAEELEGLGYVCSLEPLLAIEPLRTPPPVAPPEIRAVMITSANALEAGQGLAVFFETPCFCVGTRTADRARAAGFSDVHDAAGDGAALASLMVALLGAPKTSMPILHICGEDVDSKVQRELARHGFRVLSWPVYAARPAARLSGAVIERLRRGEIGAVTVFSVRTAQTLVALVQAAALEACCQSLTAIGLSEAVTEALRPLPWKALVTAAEPSEDALIERLKQVHPPERSAP